MPILAIRSLTISLQPNQFGLNQRLRAMGQRDNATTRLNLPRCQFSEIMNILSSRKYLLSHLGQYFTWQRVPSFSLFFLFLHHKLPNKAQFCISKQIPTVQNNVFFWFLSVLPKHAFDSVLELLCPSVCLFVCVFVTLQNTHFLVLWRLQVEGCIANTGLQ